MELKDYRFLSDEEPSDEQLEMLMREVGEEARDQNREASLLLRKQINLEVELARKRELAKAAKQ